VPLLAKGYRNVHLLAKGYRNVHFASVCMRLPCATIELWLEAVLVSLLFWLSRTSRIQCMRPTSEDPWGMHSLCVWYAVLCNAANCEKGDTTWM